MYLHDATKVQTAQDVTAETAYVLARMINAQSRMLDLVHGGDRATNARTAVEMLDAHVRALATRVEAVYDAERVLLIEECKEGIDNNTDEDVDDAAYHGRMMDMVFEDMTPEERELWFGEHEIYDEELAAAGAYDGIRFEDIL